MLLFNLRNSHKCLTCFMLSALPPPDGWIIHDGEVTVLLEIGRFIFLTAHSLLCYFPLQKWSQVRCWDPVTVWELPNPHPHPSTPGSPLNTKYCSLLLSATSSPTGQVLRSPHPSPDLPLSQVSAPHSTGSRKQNLWAHDEQKHFLHFGWAITANNC